MNSAAYNAGYDAAIGIMKDYMDNGAHLSTERLVSLGQDTNPHEEGAEREDWAMGFSDAYSTPAGGNSSDEWQD